MTTRIVFVTLLLVGFAMGCASNRRAQVFPPTWNLTTDGRIVSTNVVLYSTYNLQFYIIGAGDTLSLIARKFHVRIERLRDLNPNIDPRKLKIGAKILVAEEKIN